MALKIISCVALNCFCVVFLEKAIVVKKHSGKGASVLGASVGTPLSKGDWRVGEFGYVGIWE